MNEKIKELAERAFEESSKELAVTDPACYYSDKGPDIDIVFEKFAELIVRECIKQVEPTQHHEVWAQSYLGGVDGLDLLYSKVKQIKEHFGVKG